MYRLPNDQQRHAIVGATGSGKTQYALWELSNRNFNRMPWVVYNFKSDESIDSIPGSKHIEIEEIPEKPGIYVAHPLPRDESKVEDHMWGIWERGHTGIYVDEGYMIGRNNEAFRALLTQGRSRHIPMLVLSQRPVWMDRFVFSESEYLQMFRLQDPDDIKKHFGRYIPQFPRNVSRPVNLTHRLPEYHSYYYDVGNDTIHVVKPVPDIRTINSIFARRFDAQRRRAV